jgi:hypothetical protein
MKKRKHAYTVLIFLIAGVVSSLRAQTTIHFTQENIKTIESLWTFPPSHVFPNQPNQPKRNAAAVSLTCGSGTAVFWNCGLIVKCNTAILLFLVLKKTPRTAREIV